MKEWVEKQIIWSENRLTSDFNKCYKDMKSKSDIIKLIYVLSLFLILGSKLLLKLTKLVFRIISPIIMFVSGTIRKTWYDTRV